MLDLGDECKADAECPMHMQCSDVDMRCECLWSWGMTGDECTEPTVDGIVALTLRTVSCIAYVVPLVYVCRLLRRYAALQQLSKATRNRHSYDPSLTTMVLVAVSTFVGVCAHIYSFARQLGAPPFEGERPLANALEGVIAICTMLSYQSLSLLWIDIGLATRKLQAVGAERLRATRWATVAYMTAFTVLAAGFKAKSLTATNYYPWYYCFVGLTIVSAVVILLTFVFGARWLAALLSGAAAACEAAACDSAAARASRASTPRSCLSCDTPGFDHVYRQVAAIERTALRVSVCIGCFIGGASLYIVLSITRQNAAHWVASAASHVAVCAGLFFICRFV